jgi:hypothetical protein
MVSVAAVFLQNQQRQAGIGFGQLGPAIDMVFIWVVLLPALGWPVLRVVGARPAWGIALLGPVALLPTIELFDQPGGLHRTAWAYGLQGALAYAAAGAVVLAVARLDRAAAFTPTSAGEPADSGSEGEATQTS